MQRSIAGNMLHGLRAAGTPHRGTTACAASITPHALALFERMKELSPADYAKAVENLSAADVAAATQAHGADVQKFHRLFMLPNVAHCGGGTGPSNIGGGTGDPLPALRDAGHRALPGPVR